MFWFIIFSLTITFTIAGVITWREENDKRSKQRDIRDDWYDLNKIKRP